MKTTLMEGLSNECNHGLAVDQRDRLLGCLKELVAMNHCNYDRGTTDYMMAMVRAEAAIANVEHGVRDE